MSDINEEKEPILEEKENAEAKAPQEAPKDEVLLETRVRYDGALQRRLFNATTRQTLILLVVMGSILAVVGFALLIVRLLFRDTVSGTAVIILFCGVLAAVCGVIAMVAAKKGAAEADKRVKDEDFRFYRYYFTQTIYRYTEKVGENKVYYSDLFNVRETKEFILIAPARGVGVYPFEKSKMTVEQVQLLRSLLPVNRK